MNKQTAHLRALTGLRFVAALLVFVHHCRDFSIHGAPFVDYPLGAIGVAFFFVLSGFIMTFVYGSRLTAAKIPAFYLTRIARIWPLHIACLTIFVLINVNIGELFSDSTERIRLLVNAFLIQSWTFDRDWIISFNGPSWSLSTEMGFYLVFPILILMGRRKFLIAYCTIGILTVASLVGIDLLYHQGRIADWVEISGVVQSFPMLRLFEFATGMMTAYYFLARRERQAQPVIEKTSLRATILEILALGFAVSVIALLWSRDLQLLNALRSVSGPAVSSYVRFSGALICFAPMILVFAKGGGAFGKLFGSRTFVWLGEISFAFYLIHRIVIRSFVRQVWLADYMPPIFVPIIVFVICLGCSAILHSVVEVPCKQAILAFFGIQSKQKTGNRFANALATWFQSTRESICKLPVAMLAGLAVIMIVSAVIVERNEHESELEWRLIYQGRRMSPEVADIHFEGQAVLRAVSFRHRGDELVVRSIWIPEDSIDMDLLVSLQGKKRGRVIERSPKVRPARIKRNTKAMWIHQARYPIEKTPAGACIVYTFQSADRSERTKEVRVPIPRNLRTTTE